MFPISETSKIGSYFFLGGAISFVKTFVKKSIPKALLATSKPSSVFNTFSLELPEDP